MRKIYKILIPVLTLLSLITANGFSQGTAGNLKLISAAKEIISSASTCALITLDKDGKPSVRAMETLPIDHNFIVWFGTNPKSRKVAQIKRDSRVTLYYLDSDGSGYVMIHGVAQIVDDQKEKEKRWKVEWEAFYPNKPEDYLLIKVSPKWMEVISYTYGIVGNPTTWEPPSVLFD